jgi:hypothetical protein
MADVSLERMGEMGAPPRTGSVMMMTKVRFAARASTTPMTLFAKAARPERQW